MALIYGCSTKKNTRGTRAYHELTTRYNVFFNAQESYDATLNSIFDNHKDKWHTLLPLYPNSRNVNDTIEKTLGGPFDRVVEKTTKAIQEHSISAKPKRDRGRMGSQEYRDWLRQNEFNPFIDQAWLLMGKAHIQNGDYLEAISVFANTIRLFSYDLDVVSEAQIWLMRAYAEIGWFVDAEIIVDGLQARSIPDYLRSDYVNAYTLLLIKQERFEEAIPFLAESISIEKNSTQKRRMRLLLGQIYSKLGNNDLAFDAFERVKGINTPYEISLNALIAQSKVSSDSKQIVDALKKQSKRQGNESILDQIYGAIGDYYIAHGDTVAAVDNYLAGESKSVSNGVDKALIQEKLGQIYYSQKNYIASSKRYIGALSQFPNSHAKYGEVVHRAEVLSDLAPHIVALNEQDSLQHLASLPRGEQLVVINSHISYLKKLERDESTKSLVDKLKIASPIIEDNISILPKSGSTFYFYNPQQVNQGVVEFKKRWGNRILEDNWRLSSSTTNSSTFEYSTDNSEYNIDKQTSETAANNNASIYSPEYWLEQLPVTPEKLAASNALIESSLYNIGNIARVRLYDYDLAINAYTRIYNDFEDSDLILEVAYSLYMIYRQMGDTNMANIYRNKITTDYADSDYAIMLTDPEYESVMKNYSKLEDALYQESYKAYQNRDAVTIQKSYNKAIRLFNNGSLISKFSLLNALSYALIGDVDNLKTELERLVTMYSDSEEAIFAQSIIDRLSDGMELVHNASALAEMDWMSSVVGGSYKENNLDYAIEFDDDRAKPHSLLLMFNDKVQSKNDLLFALANHNFSNYQLRAFTISFMKFGERTATSIKSFSSYDEAKLYADRIESDLLLKESISDSLTYIVISDDNVGLLFSSESVDQYVEFNKDALGNIASDKKEAEIVIELDDVEAEEDLEMDIESKDTPLDIARPLHVPVKSDEKGPTTIEDQLKELERRQEQALNQSDKPLSDKERKRQLRDREKDRKKLIKQRQQDLKLKEKQRNEELKRREKERQLKIQEQEKIRKAKLNERSRLLREQNR